jgi:hypothetical protein
MGGLEQASSTNIIFLSIVEAKHFEGHFALHVSMIEVGVAPFNVRNIFLYNGSIKKYKT